MVNFDVPEEAPTAENRRASFGENADKAKSTMTMLTMDKSKSFYNKDYKKEHIGESREYWSVCLNSLPPFAL